ncbi:MAG: type ISP restriction/modification enzyme [Bradymonadaceae bacterium]
MDTFDLNGRPFIELCNLLKLTGYCSSGGSAKLTIAAGEVKVDDQIELRKRCKIRPGQIVEYGELLGSRQKKIAALSVSSTSALCETRLKPGSDNYWRFLPLADEGLDEWQNWLPLPELFESWGAGVLTNRNGLAISQDRGSLLAKIERFADLTTPTPALEEELGFRSNYRWDTQTVRERFAAQDVEDCALPYLFRPFDKRWIYWHPDIVYNMRGDKLAALMEPGRSLGLMFSRNTRRKSYTNVFVTDCVADRDCLEKANIAPLHILSEGKLRCNIVAGTREHFTETVGAVSGRDILHYIYAVLQSSTYRTRYFSRLQMEFPRLPMTPSPGLFDKLRKYGADLVALHLLDESYLWASWNHAGSCPGSPLAAEHLPAYQTASKPGSEPSRQYRVGGYPVLQKYIRGRKKMGTGPEEVLHLRRMMAAIAETFRLAGRIDAVVDEHGGWAEAFNSR